VPEEGLPRRQSVVNQRIGPISRQFESRGGEEAEVVSVDFASLLGGGRRQCICRCLQTMFTMNIPGDCGRGGMGMAGCATLKHRNRETGVHSCRHPADRHHRPLLVPTCVTSHPICCLRQRWCGHSRLLLGAVVGVFRLLLPGFSYD